MGQIISLKVAFSLSRINATSFLYVLRSYSSCMKMASTAKSRRELLALLKSYSPSRTVTSSGLKLRSQKKRANLNLELSKNAG